MTESELLKVSLVCAAFIAATLLWVFGSKQTAVPRKAARAFSIAVRIVLVHGAVVGFFYGLDGVAIDTLLKWLPVGVVLLLLTKPKCIELLGHFFPFDGVLGVAFAAAISFTVFMPLYLLKQFVLGFPDKPHWDRAQKQMREPPEQQLPTKTLPDFPPAGTVGVVSAALRPMGMVEIEGTAFPARHPGNQLLAVGTSVLTCGAQNGTLLVKESDAV
ncbi:hypothetical protein [Fuerstiella marisgermanici]|nr:hypothetical protein [Fuerstiella marisgermanici]